MAETTPTVVIILLIGVGLDPAQPLFEGYKKVVQLDADDALFVEVMHTDAKPTVPLLGAGILRAVGKVITR